MDTKHRGAHSELVACAWLLRRGYEVFRNVSQHGLIDLIAMKDGKTLFIDVKTASRHIKYGYLFAPLSNTQLMAGIVPLYVLDDGDCLLGVQLQTQIKYYKIMEARHV